MDRGRRDSRSPPGPRPSAPWRDRCQGLPLRSGRDAGSRSGGRLPAMSQSPVCYSDRLPQAPTCRECLSCPPSISSYPSMSSTPSVPAWRRRPKRVSQVKNQVVQRFWRAGPKIPESSHRLSQRFVLIHLDEHEATPLQVGHSIDQVDWFATKLPNRNRFARGCRVSLLSAYRQTSIPGGSRPPKSNPW